MKKISIIFVTVVSITFVIAVWLYANESSKADKVLIKDIKTQTQDTTKATQPIVQTGNNVFIPYNGEPGGDRVEDSYRLLELNKERFHLVNPRQELKLKGVIGPDNYGDIKTTAVKFDQVVNGIKVASAGYTVQFESNGAYYFCHGEIDTSARHVNTNPAISKERAEQIAFNDTLNFNTKAESRHLELLIAKVDDGLRLVWSFGVINERGDSWKYLIDAQTGKVLEAKNAAIY
jgi:Zn-dependent metalloprotease